MLPHQTTKQEDAVEKHFCIPFENLERHPMDKDGTEILLLLMMSKDKKKELPQKQKPFIYQVIEKRAQASFTFKIADTRLIMFLSYICESPGTAVMYLTYLQYWCKKHEVKELDLDYFCSHIFPMGFPNDADLSTVWKGQKVLRDESKPGFSGSDNLLDYQSAMVSIQYMKPAQQPESNVA